MSRSSTGPTTGFTCPTPNPSSAPVTSVRHVIPPLDRKGLLVPHFPAHPLLAAPTRDKEGLLDASKPCPGPSGDSLPSMQFQAGLSPIEASGPSPAAASLPQFTPGVISAPPSKVALPLHGDATAPTSATQEQMADQLIEMYCVPARQCPSSARAAALQQQVHQRAVAQRQQQQHHTGPSVSALAPPASMPYAPHAVPSHELLKTATERCYGGGADLARQTDLASTLPVVPVPAPPALLPAQHLHVHGGAQAPAATVNVPVLVPATTATVVAMTANPANTIDTAPISAAPLACAPTATAADPTPLLLSTAGCPPSLPTAPNTGNVLREEAVSTRPVSPRSPAAPSPGVAWLSMEQQMQILLPTHKRLLVTALATWAYHCRMNSKRVLQRALILWMRASPSLRLQPLVDMDAKHPVTVALAACFWIAMKCDGHRRLIVKSSKLAQVTGCERSALPAAELYIMEIVDWNPYKGLAATVARAREALVEANWTPEMVAPGSACPSSTPSSGAEGCPSATATATATTAKVSGQRGGSSSSSLQEDTDSIAAVVKRRRLATAK